MRNKSSDKRFDLYFIAILVDQAFASEITKIKYYFAEKYSSDHALRSPPHITLHMPFRWPMQKVGKVEQILEEYAQAQQKFTVELTRFGSFPPRVIYIHVENSLLLGNLQKDIRDLTKNRLKLFNSNYKGRPFHPHVTVAFRDLSRKNYNLAWEEFSKRKLYHMFEAQGVTLLKHTGKKWDAYETFPFHSNTR